MPASMTAAMIFSCGASLAGGRRAADAGGGEAVGDLVQRAAHVEGHHQAEDHAEQDALAAAHAVQAVGELGPSARRSACRTRRASGSRRSGVVNSGMTSTGIRPRAQVGTFQRAIQWAITPASTPPTIAPRKPVCGMPKLHDVGRQAAHHEAGRDARTVGDREGDVAGQRRDEERERGLADHEEDRAEVGEQAASRTARGRDRAPAGSGRFVQASCWRAMSVERDRRSRSRRAGTTSAISRPPAATNGIMYDTPVISTRRVRRAPALAAAATGGGAGTAPPPAAPSTRGAFGSSA